MSFLIHPPMPRPRTFDREEVLDRALETFWCQGYEATSVQDLVDTMGISRASLYNAFGSKHDLFMEVLKHYEAQRVDRTIEMLREGSSARRAIRDVFEHAIDEALTADRRGCLITNTATEMCARDAECAEQVQRNFARVERAFETALQRGQASGELSFSRDVTALARFFTNTLQGIRVMAKTRLDRVALEDVVQVAMQVLD